MIHLNSVYTAVSFSHAKYDSKLEYPYTEVN